MAYPNGLRTILAERGINSVRMKADDMHVVMSNHDDFVNEKMKVEHYIKTVLSTSSV